MILVTTPTGNTGSLILQHLVEQGQQVKIFVRDSGKYQPVFWKTWKWPQALY